MLYPGLASHLTTSSHSMKHLNPTCLNVATPDGVTYILVSNRVLGRIECTLLRATSTTMAGSYASLLLN